MEEELWNISSETYRKVVVALSREYSVNAPCNP